MAMKKTYFIAPTYSAAPNGPIRLGNIISNPATPDEAINKSPVNLPSNVALYCSTVKNWKWENFESSSQRAGVFLSFLQILGLGVEAGTEHGRANVTAYSCDELETQYFQPTDEYIAACTQLPEIQRYIVNRQKLYVITGIKIAKGANVVSKALRSRGINLSTTVDLSVLGGTPVQIGPGGSVSQSSEESTSFDVENDFVLAYRLREIIHRWKIPQHRQYKAQGQLYSTNAEQESDSEKHDENYECKIEDVELLGVAEEDFAVRSYSFKKSVIEDGEVVDLVKLQ